jgi:hypothetical protein
MKDQPPIFFLTDINIHSEIILTDPIYRLVAGGETSPWEKPSCDISPCSDIGVRAEIRAQNPTQG